MKKNKTQIQDTYGLSCESCCETDLQAKYWFSHSEYRVDAIISPSPKARKAAKALGVVFEKQEAKDDAKE